MTAKKSPAFLNAALFAVLLLTLGLAQAAQAGWQFKDKTGEQYTLSGLHGKWVLVNFWAPWCPSCLQEMPDLNALQKKHQNLQVIGVAVMYKSHQEVADMAGKQSLSYPVVFGTEDTAGEFGGLDGLPTSFLYAPSGELVGQHQGPLTQNDIEQVMAHKPEAAKLFTR